MPVHLVHNAMQDTSTIIAWLVVGFVLTAVGGRMAGRADVGRRRIAGTVLTIAGVIFIAAGVWYHQSMRP